MSENTTLIVLGLGALCLLGAMYFLTRPKPANNDISIGDAAKLVAMYYGYGA